MPFDCPPPSRSTRSRPSRSKGKEDCANASRSPYSAGPINPTSLFHPAVAAWFAGQFAAPTPAQVQAWPAIQAHRHTLIAAPTGSGKTLAAFLAAIDGLVRQGLDGCLDDATQVVYVSPLKALSNDIQRNLEAPLAGIRAALRERGLPDVEIRTWVRTGDTPAGERERMRRRPPHILVTTPESLYILLGSASGRTHAGEDAHRDRGRNPRHGAEQARRASGAVAGAAGGAVRRRPACASGFGDAESDRGDCAFPGRAADDRPRRARSSTRAISVRANWRSKCPTRRSKR